MGITEIHGSVNLASPHVDRTPLAPVQGGVGLAEEQACPMCKQLQAELEIANTELPEFWEALRLWDKSWGSGRDPSFRFQFSDLTLSESDSSFL